ncbi:transmembrane and ubiquitin-like domain-containing protein 1 isoform X1 [Galleria mellonella]|uniref:Transmembrane and ubiquitin-like domain-containing protein 1 isoform X1 n=1 Tax=Galleria mellonella TaxID=7137 RepID=A0A6J1WUI3_GALME|nr:transmembrane and ubiquitin-like domain-containing protein 1 isoform X1 [Galleria mellonella]XP_026759655.2 transmembrane and ubiquitin-like domain-containing protein 1 isoform X1 [Galleria mellonella]
MMTLIEGVGDEVIQFVAVVLVILVAVLAWWSTNARPDRYHTVLVMRSRAHHPVTVSIRTRSNVVSTTQASSSLQPITSEPVALSSTSEPVEENNPRDNSRVIPLQEMDSIVDADMAMLDNNRLHFYRRIDSAPSGTQSVAESTSDESEAQEEPASNAQIREMDSIVSAMEADVTAGCDFFTRPNESNTTLPSNTKSAIRENNNDGSAASTASETNGAIKDNSSNNDNINGNGTTSSDEPADSTNRKKILIKLKYLNDTLKEVEGNLDELLKDFKWRHFATELSAESRVRLIFNGRVLVDDAATLRACGLHDRAVVHCLVHPKRANNQQRGITEEATVNATHELITEGVQPDRPWDLENILMTLVSVALTVVWFFRCEYSNMFTASASVALFGLTVFYSVAIFGLYLSDTFHFDRRPAQPAQPVPNN